MASNKNQHFVPKCYLRPFSADESASSINLFNLAQGRSIHSASIRGQCSSNYFYGDDPELEKALQFAEGSYASFLRQLAEPNYRLTNDHVEILRYFCLLQYCRTDAQARRNLAFMSGMTDVAFNGSTPTEYLVTAKQAVQMAMRIFADSMSLVDDLKVKLVRNRTKTDFITSDNPSIHTNRWHLQSPKARGHSPGISNAGIILLLPLTPRFLCLIYDGDVYTVDHNNHWVDVGRADDVESLNDHQFLNCQSNVYFSNWQTADEIQRAYTTASARRPAKRHEIITAVLDRRYEQGKRYKVVPPGDAKRDEEGLIHVREVFPHPARWPRFLRIRSDAKVYSNSTGTGFLRAWTLSQGRHSGVDYKKV
jgi:hypothetical protein